MIEYNKFIIQKREKEISQYMDIMDQITSIFKIDVEGQITEANELICEISEYEKDALIKLNINDILNKDAVVTNFHDLLKLMNKDGSYTGKVKYQSKSGEIFYLNTTIMTMHDSASKVSGYICIGLDQTGTELEKQQTMQRVRKNIMEQRTKETLFLKKIKTLEDHVQELNQKSVNSQDAEFIVAALNKEKQKVASLNTQLTHYEKEIANLTKQKNMIVSDEKVKKAELFNKTKELSKENHIQQTKIIELQAVIAQLEEKQRGTTVG
jgi:PAS domain S-box-containing protein